MGDAAVSVALERLANPDEVELWLDVLEEIADGPGSSEADVGRLVDAWRRWAHDSRPAT